MLPSTLPQPPERMFVTATDLENRMETGAIAFSRYLKRIVDANSWSHPQMVALCKLCTDQKAWLHNSQIAGLLKARLKSPGPRSFVALEFLFRAIDAHQKGDPETCEVKFGNLAHLVEHAQIMRDENGNPASMGYLMEVFSGLREVPIDISSLSFTEKQAIQVSEQAGRLIRRLMAVDDLDPIADAEKVSMAFGGSREDRLKCAAIIKGTEQWTPDEIEEAMSRLSKLMRDSFHYIRSARELQDEFLAPPRP